MQNHFELFHLPQQFDVDPAALSAAFREVQNQVHPDKFVQAGAAGQRVAMQWSTRANEAYQVLKNPLQRAAYLCELAGVPLQLESNTAMPRAFLMQQMEWREALHEVRASRGAAQDNEAALATLEALDDSLRQQRQSLLADIKKLLDAGQFQLAAEQVRCLMFVERFGEEVAQTFELLES